MIHDTLPEIRRYGSPELLARTLLMAADIQESSGKPGPALSYLCEATGLTQFVDDSYVVFTAHYNLTHLYLRSGNGPKALASLETVLSLGKNIEDLVPIGHIFLLKGAVYRVSGKLAQSREALLKARDEFGTLKMSFYVVLVDLELSLLCLGQGRSDQALGLVVETLPVISEFCAQYQGAAATLAIFQESERRKNIGESEIKKALSQLDRIRKTPRFQYSRGVEVSATQAGRFAT